MNASQHEVLKIQVAASVVADISTGIYRTPANALKELVSNSFDADATEVVISTGYPDFRTMTCSDNGVGLTAAQFKEIMNYIGGSAKRQDSDFTPRGRPKIGKIGIGLLAVAEICTKFRVFSSVEGVPRKFEAEVDLRDFSRPETVRKHLGEEEIGQYTITELAERPDAHYTIIVLENIKPDFRDALRTSAAERVGLVGPAPEIREDKFRDFVESITDLLLQTSEYHRFLWELSLVSPAQYLSDGPFFIDDDHFLAKKEQLQKFNFKVICDGFELRKPLLFPTDQKLSQPISDFKVYNLSHSKVIDNRRISLVGYLFHQRTAIRPSHLQGVLIRLRNVAIGPYDRSLLGFPGVPGPMSSQLSGEIYVEEGLEDAMNIDRASFRESDALYLELQRYFFEFLRPTLQDLRSRSRERMGLLREEEAQRKASQVLSRFAKKLSSTARRTVEINVTSENGSEPVTFDPETGAVQVNTGHPIFRGSSTRRTILAQVLVAYEVAEAIEPGNRGFLFSLLEKI